MQKLALFAGAVVMALGVGAASSSAFAMGCLDNQNQMVTPSLSLSVMPAPSGNGTDTNGTTAFDVAQYNALLAKGNACPSTEQSLPFGQQQTSVHRGVRY